jgi:hypothetical protein
VECGVLEAEAGGEQDVVAEGDGVLKVGCLGDRAVPLLLGERARIGVVNAAVELLVLRGLAEDARAVLELVRDRSGREACLEPGLETGDVIGAVEDRVGVEEVDPGAWRVEVPSEPLEAGGLPGRRIVRIVRRALPVLASPGSLRLVGVDQRADRRRLADPLLVNERCRVAALIHAVVRRERRLTGVLVEHVTREADVVGVRIVGMETELEDRLPGLRRVECHLREDVGRLERERFEAIARLVVGLNDVAHAAERVSVLAEDAFVVERSIVGLEGDGLA